MPIAIHQTHNGSIAPTVTAATVRTAATIPVTASHRGLSAAFLAWTAISPLQAPRTRKVTASMTVPACASAAPSHGIDSGVTEHVADYQQQRRGEEQPATYQEAAAAQQAERRDNVLRDRRASTGHHGPHEDSADRRQDARETKDQCSHDTADAGGLGIVVVRKCLR
jgi:hypothetical protein